MSRHTSGGTRARGASGLKASLLALAAVAAVFVATPVMARDAAFLDPGSGSSVSAADDAIRVEPKNDIDVGESILNVARRVDLLFVNQSGQPVKVEKISVNGDGNVASEIANDDCSKQATIAPGSRCSVAVSITPSSPGAWSAQVLMTHDGAGRIARARLSGKTGGTAAGEKKDTGLALSTKEINPVNFGDVEIGDGKVVRSALMVNDSVEPITLFAIDVIEASNGLQRLEQGCAVDMELKPGESCPVTLVWTPNEPGQVSTDLIIRHSGRLGFAVVPIRGMAKGIPESTGKEGKSAGASGGKGSIPPPPSATDLEKAANGKIQPVSAAALGNAAKGAMPVSATLTLIGTVGNRAVFAKSDGHTAVVSAGEEIDLGDATAKVTQVGLKSADVIIDGKKKTLLLQSSADLVARATAQSAKTKDKEAAKDKDELGGLTSSVTSPPIPAVGASSAPSGGQPLLGGASYGSSMSGAAK